MNASMMMILIMIRCDFKNEKQNDCKSLIIERQLTTKQNLFGQENTKKWLKRKTSLEMILENEQTPIIFSL